MGCESSDVVRFDLGPCLQGQMRVAKLKSAFNYLLLKNTVYIQFYSEIPLPFPNSSYLLEPSNPMANAEMRFLRLYNNLNQAIGLQ